MTSRCGQTQRASPTPLLHIGRVAGPLRHGSDGHGFPERSSFQKRGKKKKKIAFGLQKPESEREQRGGDAAARAEGRKRDGGVTQWCFASNCGPGKSAAAGAAGSPWAPARLH